MQKLIIFIITVFFAYSVQALGTSSSAQSPFTSSSSNIQSNAIPQNYLGISALPFFYHGYGLSYTRHISGDNWIKISPSYYSYNNSSSLRLTDLSHIKGVGISLDHMVVYHQNRNQDFILYFEYGLNYTKFDIENHALVSADIKAYGIDVLLGFRKTFLDIFFLDANLGYGNRWIKNKVSNLDPTHPEINAQYNQNIFDYGRQGGQLVINLGLGIVF